LAWSPKKSVLHQTIEHRRPACKCLQENLRRSCRAQSNGRRRSRRCSRLRRVPPGPLGPVGGQSPARPRR
jgi:hypothetical protein